MSTVQRGFVGIFVKEPRPGHVKTRLARGLSPAWAADLYGAFLRDTLELAHGCAGDHVVLFHDGASPGTYLPAEILPPGWKQMPQRGADLGRRLAAATIDAASSDLLPLLLLGSDSPDLPARLLRQALDSLYDADLVLGPAADGGLWGIGVGAAPEGLFEDLPWSTSGAGSALRNRARALGLKVADLPLWYDVDEPADLIELDHRLLGESKAKWTSAWLATHAWRAAIG